MNKRKSYLDREENKKSKINDLEPFQQNINILFKVLRKTRTRKIQKNNTNVCECLIADDTGSILLTVWNDDIEMLEQGEYFALYDGYINIHRNKLKLNKKKFGEIEPCPDQGYEINSDNNLSNKNYDETLTLLNSKTVTPDMITKDLNIGQGNVKIVGMNF